MSTLWKLDQLALSYWLNDTSDITESGGDVSQWNDTTDNDNHVTQATGSLQPSTTTQNGLRALIFSGSRMDFVSEALGVYRDTPYAWCFVVRQQDNDGQTAHSVFWSHGTAVSARLNVSAANNAPRVGGRRLDADSFESVVSGTSDNGWLMQLGILDYQNQTLYLYVDGELVATDTGAWSGSGNSSDTDSDSAAIGDAPGGTAAPFSGVMGEVSGGREALSSDDIDKMFGSAAHHWGLEGNLDAGHPYKAEAPTLPTVENVQATVLGTDSIEVTWDQFENDESPPVAADGYEIEIDSGAPLDVGDNLTYPHLNLDPSTQYSYRVRGYYSGSPIEYTEWSETVQATTESEELTTIPKAFIITADIKLRDEAPEVTEPPVAFEEGGDFIAVSIDQATSETDSIYVYSRTNETMALVDSYLVPDYSDAVVTGKFNHDNSLFAVALEGIVGEPASFATFTHSNGVLTHADSELIGDQGGRGNEVAWVGETNKLLIAHAAGEVDPRRHLQLYECDASGILTKLDDYDGRPSGTGNGDCISVHPTNSDRVLFGGGIDPTVQLLSIAGDTITKVDDLTPTSGGSVTPTKGGIAWHPDGELFAVKTANTVFLMKVENDEITQLDDELNSTGGGVRWSLKGEYIVTSEDIFTHDGSSLTHVQSYNANGDWFDITKGGNFIVTGEDSDPRIRLYRFSSGTATQVDSLTGPASAILGISFSK